MASKKNFGFSIVDFARRAEEREAEERHLFGYAGEKPRAQALGELADGLLAASELGTRIDASTIEAQDHAAMLRDLCDAAAQGRRALRKTVTLFEGLGMGTEANKIALVLEKAGVVPRRRSCSAA